MFKKGQLRIASIAGIDVYLHWSFGILVALLILFQAQARAGSAAIAAQMLFIAIIFFFVLLHEFGHALAARHFGIRTRDIILLPIGGVARIETPPNRPREEFWIALAGPAVNVGIVACLYLVALPFGWNTDALASLRGEGTLLTRLLLINFAMIAFNMIPAFPMDGGRVLRSLLAMRISIISATRIAVAIGRVFSVLFIFMSFVFNPMLMLIGLFLYAAASAELRAVELQQQATQHASPISAEAPKALRQPAFRKFYQINNDKKESSHA